MSDSLPYTEIEGIKCYSPEVAYEYADYPDSGFDLTDQEGESSFWVRSRNRLFKRIVLSHLKSAGKTKLLEIGCGTGGFIQHIVENKNLVITGSEIYFKGLKYAKNKLPTIDFVQFDVAQGEIGECFDIIVAFDVIEHIDNDILALRNIHKMLGKMGVLIITVPQHMFLWSTLDEIVKHKRRYSRRELVTKLEDNGFDVNYTTSFVFVLFPLMLISRIFDQGRELSETDGEALKKRVKFPTILNSIFDFFMRIDEVMIRLGISLPFGGTLVVVAKKR
jgi:SAM-dependent methyltransferase